MTLYEQINNACKKGYHCVVQTSDKQYYIVSPFRDGNGRWRATSDEDSIEEAMASVSRFSGLSQDYYDKHHDDKLIEIFYHHPEEDFEVGDLVDVKFPEDVDFSVRPVWKPFENAKGLEIQRVGEASFAVIPSNENDRTFIPTKYLTPHIPDQDSEAKQKATELRKKADELLLQAKELENSL